MRPVEKTHNRNPRGIQDPKGMIRNFLRIIHLFHRKRLSPLNDVPPEELGLCRNKNMKKEH